MTANSNKLTGPKLEVKFEITCDTALAGFNLR